jgi:hypothetical protein
MEKTDLELIYESLEGDDFVFKEYPERQPTRARYILFTKTEAPLWHKHLIINPLNPLEIYHFSSMMVWLLNISLFIFTPLRDRIMVVHVPLEDAILVSLGWDPSARPEADELR